MSEIDKILDDNNCENIVLYDENNKETEFSQIAVIPSDEKIYAILKPITQIDGVSDDEALLFVIDEIDGDDCLILVDDQKIIDEIFDIYYNLLSDADADN